MTGIIAGILVISAVIFHLRKVYSLEYRLSRPNIVYVNKEGVNHNPPQNFIDTFTNKTINFKISDKYNISISQIPFEHNLKYIKEISILHAYLIKYVEAVPHNEEERIKFDLLYKNAYMSVIEIIYELSCQFVKNKKKYKKALFDKLSGDVLFTLDIVEQVSDYWKLIKKKALLLVEGTTLRQTVGEEYTWSSVNLDTKKKISIESRFGKYWNSRQNVMNNKLEKTK